MSDEEKAELINDREKVVAEQRSLLSITIHRTLYMHK